MKFCFTLLKVAAASNKKERNLGFVKILEKREGGRENSKDIDKAVGVELHHCTVSFGAGLFLMAGLGLNELN